MLTISRLTYRIAGRLIFEDASAVIQPGWKVGLVGPNGTGKSTLFKLIAKELQADGGEISLSERATMGMVRQDIPDDDTQLVEIVLAADTERAALLKACETEEDPYKLGDIYERLNDIDAYAAPARAASILAGLGFKEADMEAPISAFSGGWRMRVALAAALFRQPDFLLLDEPTNHLDLEAIMWLENYLASYPKTVVIISHDRELLNVCVDHVLHVENKKLVAYTGNYDRFERERAEKMISQQKMHEKQTAQRAHMQAFVDRFKAKASKAKQAQSRLKALEKMDIVDAVIADRGIKFFFPQPEKLTPPILRIENVDVGYTKGKPILRKVDEQIDMDDRIALLGANGNGKSTLIKLIADKLEAMAGEVWRNGKLKIGYFSQHQTEELDMSSSAYVEMMRRMQGKPEAAVRAVLGKFGFNKTLADNPIRALSGGEKARLLFALMACDAPHLLLLDEPTNHLDMDTREALVQALNEFDGAVILVSHDPSMVERVADRLWLVADGGCRNFDGDLEAYRAHIIEQRRKEKRGDKAAKQGVSAVVDEKKKQFPDLYKAMQDAEKELNKLNKKKAQLEKEMGEEGFYDDADAAADVQADYGKLLRRVEEQEALWMAATESYESA
jgi:ATP-binding cassette subfamily F protein 3